MTRRFPTRVLRKEDPTIFKDKKKNQIQWIMLPNNSWLREFILEGWIEKTDLVGGKKNWRKEIIWWFYDHSKVVVFQNVNLLESCTCFLNFRKCTSKSQKRHSVKIEKNCFSLESIENGFQWNEIFWEEFVQLRKRMKTVLRTSTIVQCQEAFQEWLCSLYSHLKVYCCYCLW